ncbi:MAG: ribose 5-phosphate isomerase B [Planctomycetes bacterium RBG_16_64_10]|nr:MAG: ribose 5-phosphate isomerase B [Planctomycetes bacterium RBG_16_64_10]
MRISIGSDHRGFRLKDRLITLLKAQGHDVTDEGTHNADSVDYPDYAARVAQRVGRQEADRGILVCGTGIGMTIAANKFAGVRAAPCYDELTAELSRRHNDVNVLCLSADMLSHRLVDRLVETWLKTDFEGGRHARRVKKICALDEKARHCQSEQRPSGC